MTLFHYNWITELTEIFENIVCRNEVGELIDLTDKVDLTAYWTDAYP
jgi:hypothetical protein